MWESVPISIYRGIVKESGRVAIFFNNAAVDADRAQIFNMGDLVGSFSILLYYGMEYQKTCQMVL